MSTPATVTTSETMEAIAAQLEAVLGLEIDGLQVDPKLVTNPTPPCFDIYAADPFIERSSFGPGGGYEAVYTIRGRVTTADQQDGQELLLQFMDPRAPLSVWAALEQDATLGGTVEDSTVETVSGYRSYESAGGTGGNHGVLLGAEWRLRVVV